MRIIVMFVCVCKGITDKDIRDAVNQGEQSIKSIKETLGVASQCGGCFTLAKQIIDNQLTENSNFYKVA
jgi:bacterioferritin-associated ferredoxin